METIKKTMSDKIFKFLSKLVRSFVLYMYVHTLLTTFHYSFLISLINYYLCQEHIVKLRIDFRLGNACM